MYFLAMRLYHFKQLGLYFLNCFQYINIAWHHAHPLLVHFCFVLFYYSHFFRLTGKSKLFSVFYQQIFSHDVEGNDKWFIWSRVFLQTPFCRLYCILSLWSESSYESCLEWFLLARHGPFLWTQHCLTISQHNINRLCVCIVVGQYGSLATLLISLWVCCQMIVYLGSHSTVARSPLYLLLIHMCQGAFTSPCEECYLAQGGASI